MCPLMVEDPLDPDEIYEAWMCMNCLCGSQLDPNCGRNCICDSLADNQPGTLHDEFEQYYKARASCLANCPDCNNLSQIPFDPHEWATWQFDQDCFELDCFSFPWPSCRAICELGGQSVCRNAMIACEANCATHCPGNQQCINCCLSAKRNICDPFFASHTECDRNSRS